MPKKRIAIIIPAYNEQEFICDTINSLLAQSYPLQTIVIVDDLSTDSTYKIVEQKYRNQSNIILTQSSEKKKRESGAKVVKTFLQGLKLLNLDDYDFIGKFDSDLILPPDYFEVIIDQFESDNKLGLVGGVCQIIIDGQWKDEIVSRNDHIRGALKLYKKEAFVDIGGLDQMMGWDSLDEHKLRFNSYAIQLVSKLKVKHLRPTNRASRWLEIEKKNGTMFYQQRFGLILGSFSALKRGIKHKPYFISGVAALIFFISCYFKFKGNRIDKDLGKFIRRYRLSSFFN